MSRNYRLPVNDEYGTDEEIEQLTIVTKKVTLESNNFEESHSAIITPQPKKYLN